MTVTRSPDGGLASGGFGEVCEGTNQAKTYDNSREISAPAE